MIAAVPYRNRILVGDAAEQLRRLPDHHADLLVTSPPYFRLRDYQVPGQLGLETHVDTWVEHLRTVATEARRVLVPTGSFWLNLADSYAVRGSEGAPRKSLLLGPERLALALQRDGWIVRNKVIWHKPNPMPTSVRDRLAASWEALYLLTPGPRYFFDLDAVREPHRSRPPRRPHSARSDSRRPLRRSDWQGPSSPSTAGLSSLKARGIVGHPLGKNPGDVWSIATASFRSAHHATFPLELARRAIAAGCPERRCTRCHKPWTRPLLRSGGTARRGELRPGCNCDASGEPGLVLDPFMGAGTTAVAAERLGRDWLGIELNPGFAALSGQRIRQARARPPDG